MEQQVSQLNGAFFSKAGFGSGARFRRASLQARSDRSASREQLRQFCGNPNGCGPSMGAMFTGNVNRWLVQTGFRCGGVALTCRGNAQCMLLGCIVLLSHYPLTRVYGMSLSFIAYAAWVAVVAAIFTFAYAKLRMD